MSYYTPYGLSKLDEETRKKEMCKVPVSDIQVAYNNERKHILGLIPAIVAFLAAIPTYFIYPWVALIIGVFGITLLLLPLFRSYSTKKTYEEMILIYPTVCPGPDPLE
jgi:hypothetical protein